MPNFETLNHQKWDLKERLLESWKQPICAGEFQFLSINVSLSCFFSDLIIIFTKSRSNVIRTSGSANGVIFVDVKTFWRPSSLFSKIWNRNQWWAYEAFRATKFAETFYHKNRLNPTKKFCLVFCVTLQWKSSAFVHTSGLITESFM